MSCAARIEPPVCGRQRAVQAVRPHICLMATASPLRVSMPLNTWPNAPRPSSSPNAYRSLSICRCPVPSTPAAMLPATVDAPMALKLLLALLARLGDALRKPRLPASSAPAPGPGRGEGVSGTAVSMPTGAPSQDAPSLQQVGVAHCRGPCWPGMCYHIGIITHCASSRVWQ